MDLREMVGLLVVRGDAGRKMERQEERKEDG